MHKTIFLLIILLTSLYSLEIKPTFQIKTKGFVTDFIFDNPYVYVGNDVGSIEVFDLLTLKKVDEIQIEKFLTTKQKWIYPKIISLDKFENKMLFLTTSTHGFTNIWLYENFKLTKIISNKDKLSIKEVKILDNDNYLFATIANEVIKYNTHDSYKVYKSHLEQSSFSDMSLNEDKTKAIVASESGRVTLFDIKSGKKLREYESLNVDNVYKIDFKQNNIITAGKDRRVGVYLNNQEEYYIKSNFLVYSVALSPDGKTGIYSSGFDSDLQTFNLYTKKKEHTLVGHFAVPTNIKFISKKQIFSSSDEKKLFYWILP